MMTFKQLKTKYSSIDNIKEDETKLMIGDIFFREDGLISLCRFGFTMDGNYLSTTTDIAKNRTPEQMDMFIQSIL